MLVKEDNVNGLSATSSFSFFFLTNAVFLRHRAISFHVMDRKDIHRIISFLKKDEF